MPSTSIRRPLLLVLHILLLLASTTSAPAQTEAITIGILLDHLEQRVHAILDSAQNAADNVVNNGAHNLMNTIQQLREQYERSLNYTIDQLSAHERGLLVGIESRIDQLFSHIQSEHDRVDDTLDNLAIYLSDSIFVDDVPRISRFLTSTAVHGHLARVPLLITVRGKNLNHPGNKLVVSLRDHRLELEPIVISDNRISFSLTQQQIGQFTSPRKITFIPVELSLFQDVFLFPAKERKYRYLVRVLPSELARVVFHYSETVPVVAERKEKVVGGPTGFFHSPLFSSRTKRVSVTHPPDEGYMIDTSTVSASWNGSDGCWAARSGCTSRPRDFSAFAECTIVSENSSRGLFEGCSYAVTLRFIQYRLVDEVRNYQTEPVTWAYGMPVSWHVPTGTSFARVEVRLFDGTTAFYSTGVSTPFMRVAVDHDSRTVTVSTNVDLRALH